MVPTSADASSVSSVRRSRGGTTREYTLPRLEREAPELHAEVMAGRLSVHAAAVQAGIHPRRFTVVSDNPATVAGYLRRNLTPEQLAELAGLLAEEVA